MSKPYHCKTCEIPIAQPPRGIRLYCPDCASRRKPEYMARWYLDNRDRIRKREETRRRSNGMRPRYQLIAEARAHTLKRAAKPRALKAQGESFSEIGNRLGMTRNAVAGLLNRAKRAESVSA